MSAHKYESIHIQHYNGDNKLLCFKVSYILSSFQFSMYTKLTLIIYFCWLYESMFYEKYSNLSLILLVLLSHASYISIYIHCPPLFEICVYFLEVIGREYRISVHCLLSGGEYSVHIDLWNRYYPSLTNSIHTYYYIQTTTGCRPKQGSYNWCPLTCSTNTLSDLKQQHRMTSANW